MSEPLKARIHSVDLLRGIVMMIMLLDHTRDFVHSGALQADPTDLTTTTFPLFFTRWVTHLCAPVFVFLSGVSIFLQRMAGKSNADLSRFLFTRGLWLIFLEFTVVRFGFTFNLDYTFVGMAQVIWVIGVSMIVMAALIYLPMKAVGIFSVAMIFLHNLLDVFQLPPDVAFSGNANFAQSLWLVLHQMGLVPLGSSGSFVFAGYPLIPWVGVMAAGWAFGTVYSWSSENRRGVLLKVGIAACVLFVVIRAINVYGDLVPWSRQENLGFTFLSFLNTTKYPPSLLYLLMTLGPALILLAFTDRIDGKAIWEKICITFGRVPMFFYILQWFTAHGFGIVLGLTAGKDVAYLFQNIGPQQQVPPDHGFSLPVVYAAWIAGLIILYPLCAWWGALKQRNKHWLLSYL